MERMEAAGGSGVSEMVFLGEKEHGRQEDRGGVGREEHYWWATVIKYPHQ